jgi:hypothetical protein
VILVPHDEEIEVDLTLNQLETAFGSGKSVPPDIDDLIKQLASGPTGLPEEELNRLRRLAVERLESSRSVGELLRTRRIALGFDEEEVSHRSHLRVRLLEDLEADTADLHEIDPEMFGSLLYVLGLSELGSLETPLRQLASVHLSVHGSGVGPLFGRTRRGVGSVARRRGLLKGIPGHDADATRRAVDAYVVGVTQRLQELASRKK